MDGCAWFSFSRFILCCWFILDVGDQANSCLLCFLPNLWGTMAASMRPEEEGQQPAPRSRMHPPHARTHTKHTHTHTHTHTHRGRCVFCYTHAHTHTHHTLTQAHSKPAGKGRLASCTPPASRVPSFPPCACAPLPHCSVEHRASCCLLSKPLVNDP